MNQIQVEPSPPMIAKKLWNIVRIVFFMMRKGISKSKLMVDFHFHYMLKRGNKIAEKAIDNLILHHSNLSCRPNDADLSFFSPREYEFSCSNSPAVPSSFYINHYKRKHHHHYRHNHNHNHYGSHDMTAVNAVQQVLDMLNKNNNNNNNNNNNETTTRAAEEEASPLTTLPGFGRSPMVRQLRITDSPFPLKDSEEDTTQVDKAAEDFIKKFYKELKQQKKKAVIESPYHDMWFG